MKKRSFWLMMTGISLFNGLMFFLTSLSAMKKGAEGLDNQAGLIFIPLLWVMAAGFLLVLTAFTLMIGFAIKKDRKIGFSEIFKFRGLSVPAKVGRICFIGFSGVLMIFALALFTGEPLGAIMYSLSGGVLLISLWTWLRAAVVRA